MFIDETRDLPILKSQSGVVDDLHYFSHAMTHPKEYKDIYSAWTDLNKPIQNSNTLKDFLIDHIRNVQSPYLPLRYSKSLQVQA